MSGQSHIPPYGERKDTAVDDFNVSHTRDVDDPLITQLHEYTTPSMAQPIPIPQPRAFGTLPRRPSLSTSSQTSFGSFISATDHHPLGSPSTSSLKGSPTISRTQHGEASSMHSAFDGRGLFEKFGEEAKMRSKDNEQRVLGEIIEHEDDPLQWLENSGDTSSSREESRESAPKADLSDGGNEVLRKEETNELNSVQTLLQEAMLVDLERTSTRSTESSEDSKNRAAQTMLSSSPTSSSFIFGRSRSLSRAASSSKSSVTESGSSSRTPTPKRSMDASTTSTTSSSPSQSFSTSVGSLSRSWVSSFLGSTSSKISSTLQAVRGHVDQQQQRVEESESPNSSSPPVPSLDSKDDGGSHQEEQENSKTKPQSTLPTLLPSQKRSSLARFFDSSAQADSNATASGSNPDSHSQPQQHEHAHAHPYPQHAKTISSSSSSTFAKHSSLPAHPRDSGTRTLTHGTPFAPHLFTGAEGAPGFAGMNRKWNEHGYNFDENDAKDMRGRGIKLVGRKEITTPVLTEEMADLIRPHLSVLPRLSSSWTLLYSLDQHGISLKTLYTRCATHDGAALLVIRDAVGDEFGACISEGIHLSKGSSYYGSGDSFLWSRLAAGSRDLRVFKWTGKNNYIALCEPSFLSFGGGDGHYGLYIDDTLLDGTTNPCQTFGNDHLACGTTVGHAMRFECVGLEVWGIDQ